MTPDPEPTLEDALDGLLAATYYARAAGLGDLSDRSAALYQDLGANAADEDWDGTDGGPDRWDEPIAAADDLYDRARSQWGDDAQLAKLAEESAELSAVASRALNGQADPDAFLEELVDARIMIEQFAHCYTPDRLEPFVEEGVGDLDRRLDDDPEIATDGGTDVVEITPAQRERFDRIREACANEHVPAPTDQSMFKSLLDEWQREDIEHGHELVVLLRDLQNAAANARSNDAEQCAVTLESFADDVEELVGV